MLLVKYEKGFDIIVRASWWRGKKTGKGGLIVASFVRVKRPIVAATMSGAGGAALHVYKSIDQIKMPQAQPSRFNWDGSSERDKCAF